MGEQYGLHRLPVEQHLHSPKRWFFDTCSTPLDKDTFTAGFNFIIFTVKSDLNGLGEVQ